MADTHTTIEIPESHRDLLDAQVGILGTIDHKDRPQLSPVWFLAEGGTVRLSLNTSRRKVKNLQRNSAVSFLILDLANPYRYLELRGHAEVVDDVDYVFADKVGAKYGGADFREHDQPGEQRVVVVIHPTVVHAVNMAG
jgi:PPOX class probable F420-dependent enzyme